MAQPLVCRWAVVGLTSSPVAQRFVADVTASADQPSIPIRHSITAIAASQSHLGSYGSHESLLQKNWDDAAGTHEKGGAASSISPPLPAVASSSKQLLALSPLDSLLLAPGSASSDELFGWASEALSNSKSVLVPRPTSLLLTAQHARALTELAREKRSWLGIIVKKRAAQAKATKRPGAVHGTHNSFGSRTAAGANAKLPATVISTQPVSTLPSSASSSSPSPVPPSPGSLRWAADECARCRERGIFESNMIGWEDSITLLECIEELRDLDTHNPTVSDPLTSRTPQLDIQSPERTAPEERSIDEYSPSGFKPGDTSVVDIAPRHFFKTPVPNHSDLADLAASEMTPEDTSIDLGEAEETNGRSHEFPDSFSRGKSVLQNFSLRASIPDEGRYKMKKEILQLRHLLSQKQAQILALLDRRADSGFELGSSSSRPQSGEQASLISAAPPVVSSDLTAAAATTESPADTQRLGRKPAIRNSLPPQCYASAIPLAASRLLRRRGSSPGSNRASTPPRTRFPSSGSVVNGICLQGDLSRPASNRGLSSSSSSTVSSTTTRRRRKSGGAPAQTPVESLRSSKVHSPSTKMPSLPTSGRAPSLFGERTSLKKRGSSSSFFSNKGFQDESALSSTGFLASTRASEIRRLATLQEQQHQRQQQQQGGARSECASFSDSPLLGGGKTLSPDPLVSRLAHELDATRTSLDSARQKLASSQRNMASLQRMYDSAKEGVALTRVEAERKETQLARKDKMLSEALERARRAEAEVKELGRSSREWGSRVRSVEAELGEVRRQTARAESAYEALRSACASNKAKWEGEVAALRAQLHDIVKEHRRKAESALRKFETVEEEWKGREGQRKGLEAVLEGLAVERERARKLVVEQVTTLARRVEEGERARLGQDGSVQEVKSELDRLLKLMRSGVTDQHTISKNLVAGSSPSST